MFNILGYFHYKCNGGTGCLYFVKFGKIYNAILDLPFKNFQGRRSGICWIPYLIPQLP